MSSFLKQSTASQSRTIGPFLDDTDFKTAETGLTIANTDIKLIKNGAASADKNSGGGTHRVNGNYGVTFDATDTSTLGELEVSCKVSGALQTFKTFQVLDASVYDMLFGTGAAGFVRAVKGNVIGTVASASTTTSITISSLTPPAVAADQFKGRIVTFADDTTTAALRGQSTDITASSSGGVLTVTALTTAPAVGDTFAIT